MSELNNGQPREAPSATVRHNDQQMSLKAARVNFPPMLGLSGTAFQKN